MDSNSEILQRLSGMESALREDVSALEVRLVDRMGQGEAALRKEMSALEVQLVGRTNQLEVRMERGFGALRADMIKWSFAFWMGQVVAIAAILAALLP